MIGFPSDGFGLGILTMDELLRLKTFILQPERLGQDSPGQRPGFNERLIKFARRAGTLSQHDEREKSRAIGPQGVAGVPLGYLVPAFQAEE
jgi:hypothetical protein